MEKVTDAKAKTMLDSIPRWNLSGSKLVRHFEFKNFVKNMEFITEMAHVAEEEGHHPDFRVQYNKLTVELSTHDVGGLSDADFKLAKRINEIQF